jgi:hypothetical protein
MNNEFNETKKKKYLSPADDNGKVITSARRCLTRTVIMTGGVTKDKILLPLGSYDVNITHATGGTFTYYEGKATASNGTYSTYVEGGITYGTGKVSGDLMIPCYDEKHFWILGTGSVEIMFLSIKEA